MVEVVRFQGLHTIGSRVTLRTQEGENISGVIFGCSFDGPDRVIVVKQSGSTPFHTNLRIIKHDVIETVESTPPEDNTIEPLPPVDEGRCREREAKAVRAAEVEAAKIGIGVTDEAQAVFYSLAKTLPCRWEDKTIVVLDEVYVKEPYRPENCSSLNPDDTATLDRVVKILIAEGSKEDVDGKKCNQKDAQRLYKELYRERFE